MEVTSVDRLGLGDLFELTVKVMSFDGLVNLHIAANECGPVQNPRRIEREGFLRRCIRDNRLAWRLVSGEDSYLCRC